MQRHPYHLAICFILLITAGSWGLFWIPQRALEANGLTGGWGTIAQMYVPLLMLAPIAIWRKIQGKSFGLDYPLIGLLMGGGIACYANSFLLTDVVRALILFYMTPVWATLYELLFRKQKPQWHRAVTITLALSGVWIVFSQGFTFPVPQNVGDWVALVGGMFFAGGAVRTEFVQPKDIFCTASFIFFLWWLSNINNCIFFRRHAWTNANKRCMDCYAAMAIVDECSFFNSNKYSFIMDAKCRWWRTVLNYHSH